MAVDEMRMNPDMMLFQEMVQKITPGDMSKEAEDGLRMVLERLKSGGAMTEKEREMFGSVIGAMPASANMRMRTGAAMSPEEDMRMRTGAAMSPEEDMRMRTGAAISPEEDMRMRTGAAMSDQEMKRTYQVDDGMEQMTPSQMADMQRSGAITPDKMTYMIDGQPMEMATSTYDEAVRLGIITPDTVMENIDGMEIARPPMAPEQSLRPELRPEPMRPRMRPENLGG